MHMRTALNHLHTALIDLAGVAAKLDNQNLADQLKAAAGKVQMAAEHPDSEAFEDIEKLLHPEQPELKLEQGAPVIPPLPQS